jgi:hypothetical protein
MDEFTSVAVPSVEQEAARDLVRAREDARGDLMRARHRLSKLLLRHDVLYCDGRAWTDTHDAWLRRLHFEPRAVQLAFESDYEAMLMVKARRDRLDDAIAVMAEDSEFTALTRRLGCLRGVATLTGFALAVEVGDWHRFTGATIGAFVGLVPSEFSSGASRVQGSITKTGNTHIRRLLVEAAWHHRTRYRVTKTMLDRWDLADPAARARGDEGNRRLHHRWVTFTARRKRPVIANVAVARERAGVLGQSGQEPRWRRCAHTRSWHWVTGRVRGSHPVDLQVLPGCACHRGHRVRRGSGCGSGCGLGSLVGDLDAAELVGRNEARGA